MARGNTRTHARGCCMSRAPSSSHPLHPPAPPRQVTEIIGGLSFDDPYQWLEEDTPEVLAWQAAQNARAAEYVRGWPGFDELYATLTDELLDSELDVPVARGTRRFVLTREPGAEQRVL